MSGAISAVTPCRTTSAASVPICGTPALAGSTGAASAARAGAAGASASSRGSDERASKLHKAAAEFESVLVRQLLKECKIGGMGENGNGYGDMAIDALATAVEHGGGLGLAKTIERAIGGQLPPSGPHGLANSNSKKV